MIMMMIEYKTNKHQYACAFQIEEGKDLFLLVLIIKVFMHKMQLLLLEVGGSVVCN